MFQSARIKLTIWYVLISMIVSVVFSSTIFTILHHELDFNETRLESRLQRISEIDPQFIPDFHPHRQDIQLTEEKIELNLLYANMIVLVISLFAGYFLAGRTLKPIKEMVDKQNQFITDASHELRTPLTALKTTIEVTLRDKHLSIQQAKNSLKDNLEEVDRLKYLSDNLLTLTTIHINNKPYSKEKISINDVIIKAIHNVQNQAKQKEIRIIKTIQDSYIQGDANKLVELFVIFLDNSIKYSNEKTTISIISKQINNIVEIKIKDQGSGIEKKDIAHIFERFYRANKARSGEANGYGLGLSIAKEIVDFHQGSILVDSNKKGATFTIKLPI